MATCTSDNLTAWLAQPAQPGTPDYDKALASIVLMSMSVSLLLLNCMCCYRPYSMLGYGHVFPCCSNFTVSWFSVFALLMFVVSIVPFGLYFADGPGSCEAWTVVNVPEACGADRCSTTVGFCNVSSRVVLVAVIFFLVFMVWFIMQMCCFDMLKTYLRGIIQQQLFTADEHTGTFLETAEALLRNKDPNAMHTKRGRRSVKIDHEEVRTQLLVPNDPNPNHVGRTAPPNLRQSNANIIKAAGVNQARGFWVDRTGQQD